MSKAFAQMLENTGTSVNTEPSISDKIRELKAAADRKKAAGIARSLSDSSKAAGSAAAAAARAQAEYEKAKAKAANTSAATADTAKRAAQAAASAARAAAKAQEEKAKTVAASTKSSAASASAAAAAAGRAQAAEEKAQIEAAKAAAAAAQADYERSSIDRHNQELLNTAATSGNSQTRKNGFKWSNVTLPYIPKLVNAQTTQQAVQTVDDSSPVESMTTQTIETAPAVVDDSALTLPNVDVKGDNLKNSLLICGGLVLIWYLWKKRKKKRGSRKR